MAVGLSRRSGGGSAAGTARVDVAGQPELKCHGELHAGERVLVVEGVTGTGASAVEAVRAVRDCGAVVVGVLAAVDRGHGAAGLLEGVAVTLNPLFSDDELRRTATRGRA